MRSVGVLTCHLLLILVRCCHGCTVWKMGISGLASAANNLFLAFPVFYGTNGTFFIDNREFAYSCTETNGWQNGWHDFFITDDVLNWKPEHERDLGDVCRKIDLGITHPLLHDVEKSYNDLQLLSVLKVRSQSLETSPRITQLQSILSLAATPVLPYCLWWYLSCPHPFKTYCMHV